MRAEDVPDLPLVIDTDVASFIHTQRGPADRFKPLLRDHILCMSFATVAELWAGADNPKATWGKPRRDELDRFIRQHVVLPADYAVARRWGSIHALLRDQVGVNDEWIAACALAQGPPLPVVTANLKHFQAIAARMPELIVVTPTCDRPALEAGACGPDPAGPWVSRRRAETRLAAGPPGRRSSCRTRFVVPLTRHAR